jgi:ribonuclease HI
MKYIIHTDGGSRGNPGPAGIGVIIETQSGEIVLEISKYIGDTTNNIAEYSALVAALEKCTDKNNASELELEFFLDSELVVRQLNGIYKVKDSNMRDLYTKVKELEKKFAKTTYTHVLRENNKKADKLVNEALDARIGKGDYSRL